jgi:hypothetical protein
MDEENKTPITINGKEYVLEDMTDQQRTMLNHIQDLDRKVSGAKFELDQLSVGRDAFINMLTSSLEQDQ